MSSNIFSKTICRRRLEAMINAARNRCELIAAGLTSRRGLMKVELLTPSGLLFWAKRLLWASSLVIVVVAVRAQTDPGPRGGAAGAGGPISGLTVKEGKFFNDGQTRF